MSSEPATPTAIAPDGAPRRITRTSGSDNAGRLARVLRFRFANPDLLRTALTHRSILHEVNASGRDFGSPAALTNERLEFLGDAVLGAVAAEYLYHLDPDADEGELTRRRVALVRAETLVRWAREIDLGSYLYLGLGEKPGPSNRDRMLAGAFEAVVGAIALDRGFGAARRFLMRLLERDAPLILAQAEGAANPKGRLQELLQERYRMAPEYKTIASIGPDHARTFQVEVRFAGQTLGMGEGPSKREAQQVAAAAALAALAAEGAIDASDPGNLLPAALPNDD
ncbi:MAG: ribonuclease III [Thermomicrobiales bacterium]